MTAFVGVCGLGRLSHYHGSMTLNRGATVHQQQWVRMAQVG